MSAMVRMRYTTDCGVACLATVANCEWERACFAARLATRYSGADSTHGCTRSGFRDSGPAGYYGLEPRDLYRAARRLGLHVGREHGAGRYPVGRGFLLAVSHGEWQSRRHWLAWERVAGDSPVMVWDPATGEQFELGALHLRNLRPITWVQCKQRKQGR